MYVMYFCTYGCWDGWMDVWMDGCMYLCVCECICKYSLGLRVEQRDIGHGAQNSSSIFDTLCKVWETKARWHTTRHTPKHTPSYPRPAFCPWFLPFSISFPFHQVLSLNLLPSSFAPPLLPAPPTCPLPSAPSCLSPSVYP